MKQESQSGSSSTRRGTEIMFQNVADMLNLIKTSGGSPVICPDLFGVRHLGTADNYRGRLVRAFAAILDYVWPAGK